MNSKVLCLTATIMFIKYFYKYNKTATQNKQKQASSQLAPEGLLSEHHFSETALFEISQEKYDHEIFLQLMSPKQCLKNFENRFTNKIIMPKNHFE